MLMSEEQRKELLGEFYIDYNNVYSKTRFLNCINKFINTLPNFNPLTKSYSYEFKRYCEQNNLRYLNIHYFTNDISYELIGGNNYMFIASDSFNVKHIYVKRGCFAPIKEISGSLSITTIKRLYYCFVYDVVNLSIKIRKEKEIKSFLQNFKGKCYFKQKKKDKYETLIYIEDIVNYNDSNNEYVLRYNGHQVIYEEGKIVRSIYDTFNVRGINDIYNLISSEEITKEDSLVYIEEMYNKYINFVSEKMVNCIGLFNNL